MFKTILRETPLYNETANSFFESISGGVYMGDASFISTLRALVNPRMGEGEKISVGFHSCRWTVGDVQGKATLPTTRRICSEFNPDREQRIYIQSYLGPQTDTYACLELLKSKFEKAYKGWEILTRVTDFYRKQFYVLCFVNKDLKSVAIFVDNLDIRKMHYLQCSIFAFLPWYFDPEKGVSELEMSLINSLREKSADNYKAILKEIAKEYNFRASKIRRMLNGFETRYEKSECEAVRSKIQRRIEEINNYNDHIGELLKANHTDAIRLLGLETKLANPSGEDSEIMEYFLCNENLEILRTNSTELLFGVKTYLSYFDEDMASSAIDNKHSYLYHPSGASTSTYPIDAESMENLMKAIFIDQTLKIRICAVYKFDLHGSVEGMRSFSYNESFDGYLPNPHIDGHSCLGNYQRTINELLTKRNYIGALEQCIASTKSLNFGDSIVMGLFARTMYGDSRYDNRCIELPDGRVVNAEDAIKWLKEQEDTHDE